MNEPVTGKENTNANTNSSANVSSKNNKGKKIFIGLFVLVVLIIIAVVTYIANMATPKKVFESSLNKVFKSMNTINDIKTIVGDLSLDINIDGEDNNEVYDIINNLDVKLDYAIDYENKKINLGLDSSYKEKELITAHAYAKNDNAYVYLDKIFNKYIQIPLEDYSAIFNNKDLLNNYQIVVSEIEKALDKSLKEEYFTSEKSTLTIEGKETSVTKNILNLTDENYKELSKDIATSLNNDTFIKSLATLTESEEIDIKESLEELINGDIEEFETLTISIYTTGMIKKVVAFEIKDASDTLLIAKEKNDTYKYELISGEEKLDGTVQIAEKDDKNTIITTANMEDTDEAMKVSVSLEMSFKYNEKVEDVDTSNYVSYENLTESDQTTIMMNLMTNEGIIELAEIFNSMNSSDIETEVNYNDPIYNYNGSIDYYYDSSNVVFE